MTPLVAALAVGAGAAFVVLGVVLRTHDRRAELARILDLPVPGEETSNRGKSVLAPGLSAAGRALERVKVIGSIGTMLERARIPLKPGEFVMVVAGVGAAMGIVVSLLTGQTLVGAIAAVAVFPGARAFVSMKVERRRKAFEAQLPEALSVVSSSLEAGHTFLHAVEMMVEESEAPLSEEFERVIVETQLGHPLIDALENMANRVEISDLSWVVQAIRIQQTIGGSLSEVLSTLADFMRAREEVRREVRVLTAEGRMSALVLGFLPIAVFVVIKVVNPHYLDTMMHGTGLIALFGAGLSVLTGVALIRKMAKVDV